MFDDLTTAVGEQLVVERPQTADVGNHRAWLPEGTCEVLAVLEVDRDLASQPRNRPWREVMWGPARPGCRADSSQRRIRPMSPVTPPPRATMTSSRVRPFSAICSRRSDRVGKALVPLAGRKRDERGGESRRSERGGDGGGVKGRHGRVGDDAGGRAATDPPHDGTRPGEKIGADMHVIGTLRRAYVYDPLAHRLSISLLIVSPWARRS